MAEENKSREPTSEKKPQRSDHGEALRQKLTQLSKIAFLGASAYLFAHDHVAPDTKGSLLSRLQTLQGGTAKDTISWDNMPASQTLPLQESGGNSTVETAPTLTTPQELPKFVDWMLLHPEDTSKFISQWSEKIRALRLPTTVKIQVNHGGVVSDVATISQSGPEFTIQDFSHPDSPNQISTESQFLASLQSSQFEGIQVYWEGETDIGIPAGIASALNHNRDQDLLENGQFVFRNDATVGFYVSASGNHNVPANSTNEVTIEPGPTSRILNAPQGGDIRPLTSFFTVKPFQVGEIWDSNRIHESSVPLSSNESQAVQDWLAGNYYALFGSDA